VIDRRGRDLPTCRAPCRGSCEWSPAAGQRHSNRGRARARVPVRKVRRTEKGAYVCLQAPRVRVSGWTAAKRARGAATSPGAGCVSTCGGEQPECEADAGRGGQQARRGVVQRRRNWWRRRTGEEDAGRMSSWPPTEPVQGMWGTRTAACRL